MVSLNVRGSGFEGVHKVLNNLAEKIQNPDEKLMRRLGAVVLDDIDERFMTRGHGTWRPLKPETIKRKGNDFVLIDTGVMFSSVKITELAKGIVSVGVLQGGERHDPDVPGYHQKGTRRTPQRKIIDVTPQLTKKLTYEVGNWVREMVQAYGKEV